MVDDWMFLELKISIFDVTLKTAKLSFDHTNKLHFTIYSQRKQLFQKEIICHNIAVFTVFFDQINEMKSQKS